MDEQIVRDICKKHFAKAPQHIERCKTGIGNYVYLVTYRNTKYVVRGNNEGNAYADTVSYLNKLRQLDIPAPMVVGNGVSQGYPYLLLTYLEGEEIGAVYQTLGAEEKRAIAKEVVSIQRKAANMELEQAPDWKWENFVWGIIFQKSSQSPT